MKTTGNMFNVGDRVNVQLEDGEYKAEVLRINKDRGLRVQYDDGTEQTVRPTKCSHVKRGRKPLSERMQEEDVQGEVHELLSELESAKTVNDKKRIRQALRRRGHRGGLHFEGAA